MRPLNLDGDRQADLTVHGGRNKAVYAYPSEHYAYWKKELPGVDLPWGSFGENLATSGPASKVKSSSGTGTRSAAPKWPSRNRESPATN